MLPRALPPPLPRCGSYVCPVSVSCFSIVFFIIPQTSVALRGPGGFVRGLDSLGGPKSVHGNWPRCREASCLLFLLGWNVQNHALFARQVSMSQLSLYVSNYLSIIYLCIEVSTCVSKYLSIYRIIYLSPDNSIYQSIHQSTI